MTGTKIGSAPWLRAERNTVNRLFAQDVEDFAFSARQEIDWLNEHMEGVFTATLEGVDIAELLKTPRRKSVIGSARRTGSAKKRLRGIVKEKHKGKVARNLEDVFSMPPPPQPPRKPTPTTVEAMAEEEEGMVGGSSSQQEKQQVDTEITQPLQDFSSAPTSQRTHAHPARHVSKADIFRDSGNWSQSSGVQSQQRQSNMDRPHSPREPVEHDQERGDEEVPQVSRDIGGRMSIANSSYHTVPDGGEEEKEMAVNGNVEQDKGLELYQEPSIISFRTSSPFQEYVEGMPRERDIKERSPEKSDQVPSSPPRVFPVMEKSREVSDEVVEETPEEAPVQLEENGALIDVPPPSPHAQAVQVNTNCASIREEEAPSLVSAVEPHHSSTHSPSAPSSPEHADERSISPSEDLPVHMDEPTPVPTFIRKSSLSFASLPPREPLGVGSGRISANTTAETVKLGGVGRSSWLQGRRTLGRSLGDRLTIQGENAVIGEDSEENSSATETPRERKRSREGDEGIPQKLHKKPQEEQQVLVEGRRSSRKKSRGASYKSSDEELQADPVTAQKEMEPSVDVMKGVEDDRFKVAEHSRSASRRLQERIQQLSKLNASATSVSPTEEPQSQLADIADPIYPNLPQVEEDNKSQMSIPQEQAQKQLRKPQGMSVEEDEWIPPARPTFTQSTYLIGKSSSLGRSNTVPPQSTPGGTNQKLRDGLPKKMSFEDALLRGKNSRGEITAGKPSLSHSQSFNAINSLQNNPSPVRLAAARFDDMTSNPPTPKLVNKKSYVTGPTSTTQETVPTKDSPITAAKLKTAEAFKNAKDTLSKSSLPSNPATEPVKNGWKQNHKAGGPSTGTRSSSPRTPQGSLRQRTTPTRKELQELYPDLGGRVEVEKEATVKSRKNTRGSKTRSMQLDKDGDGGQQSVAKEVQEAQELKEKEEKRRAAAEEKSREEEKLRLEEKRSLAEQRRKEREVQKQLAEKKRAEEEAQAQHKRDEKEEEIRRHNEELQRRKEELRLLVEEQRIQKLKREEEVRLRQEREEELRRQEIEKRKREEMERAKKEAEEAEARRLMEEEEKRAAEEEARKQAELDELRRKQEEDIRRHLEGAEKRRKRDHTPVEDHESEDEAEVTAATTTGSTSASRIVRPKSALGNRPPSRLHPPSSGKRPPRPQPPQKERVKPMPVSIQVGTASQRAAMDRQRPPGPPSSSTLLSAMKDSFTAKDRPPTAEPTLLQSNSAPNLKKQNSNTQIAASASTSNLKKAGTVDEKKREENMRLIEARREEVRRKEAMAAAAEEEKRRAVVHQGKRTIERDLDSKKAVARGIGTKGPVSKISRVAANANLRRLAATPALDDTTVSITTFSQPQQDERRQGTPDIERPTKKAPQPTKRAFQGDEDPFQPPTAVTTMTGSTYGNRLAPKMMPDTKKRKTEEWEMEFAQPVKVPVRPPSATGKRDWPVKSYKQTYPSTTGKSASAAAKVAGGVVTTTVPTATPHIEGVKFSNEKIRFGDSTASVSSGSGSGSGGNTIALTTTPMGPPSLPPPSKTPKEKSSHKPKSALKTPNAPADGKRVFSPMKGDGIELPEIPTDSEDDYSSSYDSDSDDNRSWAHSKGSGEGGGNAKGKFPIPDWAESPALKQALVAQQTMDPEQVFGPIGPLQMEEIFRGSGPQGKARFRNRSSSANWSMGDKLTREEIEQDLRARERMIERGGWEMGVMDQSDKEGSEGTGVSGSSRVGK